MNDLTNTYLGQYYLTEVIGRGSTSVVYKGYQSSLNRYVAVKVLLLHLDPQFVVRFRREANAVAQLQHPNILPIYDYGEQRGRHYFVTQYIESGQTLDDMLSSRPLDPIAALTLMRVVLGALEYAHARGVVHRDIKPANILMPRPDWPMLADFGIAKLLDDSQQLTPPGQSVGTAIYMAPERAHSAAVDIRTDLYSAGVVLYEMLTGRVPFEGVSPVEVLRKHVRDAPPPPRSINPDLPAVVEPLLLRALAKRPGERYQSAAEMAGDVERAIGQIERAAAQRQLQHLLGQPGDRAFEPPPSRPKSYTTRKLTQFGLPALGRERGPWLTTALLALILTLALGGLIVGLAPFGGLGDGGASAFAPTPTPPQATAIAPGSTASSGAPPTMPPLPSAIAPAPAPQPSAIPSPTLVPTPAPPPPAQTTPQVAQSGGMTTVHFEDTDWQGGYRRAPGLMYGGRTATWIYGYATQYSTMQASFSLAAQPSGAAELRIEGMDSEGPAKTPISIRVNDVEIFNGPNPLPDDDHPFETGTWTTASWSFDARLLRPGRNTIVIANLAEGAFSRPPFFMLDYADLKVAPQ